MNSKWFILYYVGKVICRQKTDFILLAWNTLYSSKVHNIFSAGRPIWPSAYEEMGKCVHILRSRRGFGKEIRPRAYQDQTKKNAGRGGKEAKLKKTAFFTPPPLPSFSRLTSAELSCGRIFHYKSHKRTTHTKTRFLRRLTCSLYRRYGRHIGIVIRAAKNIVSCPGDFTTGFVVSGFHSFVIYNCSSHI